MNDLKEVEPMVMTAEDEHNHAAATACCLCDKPLDGDAEQITVREHCHLTGKYRGAAHSECNLKEGNARTRRYKIPVFFHNLKGYDSHHIISEVGKYTDNLQAIPQNYEKMISFSYGHLRYLDSMAFLSTSLDTQVENLYEGGKGKDKFVHSKRHCQSVGGTQNEHLDLMLKKGVYPYDCMNSWERLEAKGQVVTVVKVDDEVLKFKTMDGSYSGQTKLQHVDGLGLSDRVKGGSEEEQEINDAQLAAGIQESLDEPGLPVTPSDPVQMAAKMAQLERQMHLLQLENQQLREQQQQQQQQAELHVGGAEQQAGGDAGGQVDDSVIDPHAMAAMFTTPQPVAIPFEDGAVNHALFVSADFVKSQMCNVGIEMVWGTDAMAGDCGRGANCNGGEHNGYHGYLCYAHYQQLHKGKNTPPFKAIGSQKPDAKGGGAAGGGAVGGGAQVGGGK